MSCFHIIAKDQPHSWIIYLAEVLKKREFDLVTLATGAVIQTYHIELSRLRESYKMLYIANAFAI